ncbi:tetratricopeptide repeat protein [Desulfatibacillum aliphaticivorans]|uniref:tetratricopeptide repeat protein n=1 Tax=Desulfatibacillum aliphaticivorans TaxID=218208 RepID=UPI00040D4E9F|nr:tetratricopeptide repeat protein [Desulfatibacillum aliphaticivorans]
MTTHGIGSRFDKVLGLACTFILICVLASCAASASNQAAKEEEKTSLEELAEQEPECQKSLEKIAKEQGPESEDMAYAYLACAGVSMARGRMDEVEQRRDKAIEILTKAFGPDDKRIARCWDFSASLFVEWNNIDKAEQCYLNAIAVNKNRLGSHSKKVIEDLSLLGGIMIVYNRPQKARDYYKEALSLQVDVLGPEHEEISGTYCSLGSASSLASDYVASKTYYGEAIAIEEDAGRTDSLIYGRALTGIANAQNNLGEYEQARKNFKKGLPLLRSEKFEWGANYCQYALMTRQEEALLTAENFLAKTLPNETKDLGLLEVAAADQMCTMGLIKQWLGKYGESEKFHQQSREIYRRVFGQGSLKECNALLSLANLYIETPDYDNAQEVVDELFAICEKNPQVSADMYAKAMERQSRLLYSRGELDKAIDSYLKLLDFQESHFGLNSIFAVQAQHWLGGAYVDKGDFASALPLMIQAMNAYEQYYGKSHPETIAAMESVAFCCQSLGREEEARKYYEKAKSLREEAELSESHPYISGREAFWREKARE